MHGERVHASSSPSWVVEMENMLVGTGRSVEMAPLEQALDLPGPGVGQEYDHRRPGSLPAVFGVTRSLPPWRGSPRPHGGAQAPSGAAHSQAVRQAAQRVLRHH